MTTQPCHSMAIDCRFDLPARLVWDAMRWDNADFFADAGLFSEITFKNAPDEWAIVPSSRTVHLIGDATVDETLVAFDDENMHLRFRLDEPEQYGLSFFEGEYKVVSLGDATSQLTNSARFICAERSVEDMKTVWPNNQETLFAHIKFKLG